MPRQNAFVVLTPMWSGEGALVRLLAAGGTISCQGQPLRARVRRPEKVLRRALTTKGPSAVRSVILHPDDLWLINACDPVRFLNDLVADGFTLVVVTRRNHVDRGLSRALCGPSSEVIPNRARHVDVDEVAVHAQHSALADDWFTTHAPGAQRVIFEDDLVDPQTRTALVADFARRFSLDAWTPPQDDRLPTSELLWSHVLNEGELRAGLAALHSDGRSNRG